MNSRSGMSSIMDPGPPPASKCSSTPGTTELPTSFLPLTLTSTSTQAYTSTSQPTSPLLAPIYAASSHQQNSLYTPSPSSLNSTTAPALSPSPSSSFAPSSVVPEIHSEPSRTFWQKLSSEAKIGSILGFTIFLLLLLILSILFLIRHRRCARLPASQAPSIISESAEQFPSQSTLESQTSASQRHGLERSRVGRGGGMGGCRNAGAEIVVINTEAKDTWILKGTGGRMRWC